MNDDAIPLQPDALNLTQRGTPRIREHATLEETRRRIQVVARMLIRANMPMDIVEFTRKEWNIGRAQTYKLIKLARKYVIEHAEKRLGLTLDYHITAMQDMIARALREKQFGVAAQIQNNLMKAQGLWQDRKKIEVEGNLTDVIMALRGKTLDPLIGDDEAQK